MRRLITEDDHNEVTLRFEFIVPEIDWNTSEWVSSLKEVDWMVDIDADIWQVRVLQIHQCYILYDKLNNGWNIWYEKWFVIIEYTLEETNEYFRCRRLRNQLLLMESLKTRDILISNTSHIINIFNVFTISIRTTQVEYNDILSILTDWTTHE